ncbi:SRPBCC family protein [Georgenia sp. TF02-10]|uniref:SRPBCC family protein n=1 Tax=Georgenia sp. TF02-10 TaxID=2917725 RepID=UPI001FA7AAB4|nr:SRPBCC family protein [Georgenia sp. TF02-10]UNX54821.1 SRPBCC family protein [Georgenia sp. TF02-10]
MAPTPTGELRRTAEGYDLVLARTFAAPIDDVWASVTEPERTALWFGAWRGTARPGGTIEVQLGFEDGAPWTTARIEACEPPHRLAVTTSDQAGSWHLELLLAEAGGTIELRLVHHLTSTAGVGDIGPGWEYYLDLLVAARDGSPRPRFEDYHPSTSAHFERQAAALA